MGGLPRQWGGDEGPLGTNGRAAALAQPQAARGSAPTGAENGHANKVGWEPGSSRGACAPLRASVSACWAVCSAPRGPCKSAGGPQARHPTRPQAQAEPPAAASLAHHCSADVVTLRHAFCGAFRGSCRSLLLSLLVPSHRLPGHPSQRQHSQQGPRPVPGILPAPFGGGQMERSLGPHAQKSMGEAGTLQPLRKVWGLAGPWGREPWPPLGGEQTLPLKFPLSWRPEP